MIQDQPAPQPNTSRPVWELVVEDMQARDQVGRERYGTPLQANNGRDALVDAYQEALDLVVYLRQALEERAVDTSQALELPCAFDPLNSSLTLEEGLFAGQLTCSVSGSMPGDEPGHAGVMLLPEAAIEAGNWLVAWGRDALQRLATYG